MELTIFPTEAASIRGGDYADKNFLSLGPREKGLDIKTGPEEFTRYVLFTFDLTPLKKKPFQKVFFTPYCAYAIGNSEMRCDLYLNAPDWKSETVTWGNAPTCEEKIYENGLLASLSEMDITKTVNRLLKNGESKLSFTVKINHACKDDSRAALSAEKSVLTVTEENREEQCLTIDRKAPTLTPEQIALLPFLPASWEAKVRLLKKMSKARFTFLVQTDTHFYDRNMKQCANNVRAVAAFARPNFIVHLGDIIRGYKYEEDNSDNLRDCMDELVQRYTRDCPSPVLMTMGNHDNNGMWCKLNGTDDLITKDEHFQRVLVPIKAHNGPTMVTDRQNVGGDSLYFYMDFDNANIRVIVVDSTDNGTDFSSFKVSDHQLKWLRETALQTDKHVIIMTHTPFMPEFPGNGNRVAGGDLLREAVEKFIAEGGHFVAYLYGHTHAQNAIVDEYGRHHISFLHGGGNAEAVMIDLEHGTLETLGFGASVDRTVSLG